MKKYIYLVIAVAVLAVALNDGGRIFVAKSTLRSETGTLASWASNYAAALPRDQVAAQLVEAAAVQNIELEQYGQDPNGIQIWTKTTVDGLWIWGTYKATLDGVPLRTAVSTPLTIHHYASAEYR